MNNFKFKKQFSHTESNVFHRANKNRPRETSSKVPVPVFRDVFQVKKTHHRDPRFDDLSGSFNKGIFEENYSFIDDIRHEEKEELEKELKHVGNNQERRKQLLLHLQRIKNQERSKKMEQQKKTEEMEQREEIAQSVNAGKKPFFPKKSEMKKKKLVENFLTLKKSGKLEKYIEKKRKKIFCKDKKRFYQ